MELFDKNGCLTDEGLQALQAGGLDELGRLETAEHLSYCDKCMDRYTALLTADALETPPHSAHKAVMAAIWVRLMQNTWGRAAVAGVAAVLAFTMWRSGTIDQLLNFRQELHTWTPETSQSQTEEALQLGKPVEDGRPSAQPEILGKPMDDDKPKQQASLAKALNDLLFGAGGPAAEKYKNFENNNILKAGATLTVCTGRNVPIFEFVVPAHSAKMISMQYVLPANTVGSVEHYIELSVNQ